MSDLRQEALALDAKLKLIQQYLEYYSEDELVEIFEDSFLGMVSEDISDYSRKLDLIRGSIAYYSDEDIVEMFDQVSIINILRAYDYDTIKTILSNHRANILEKDADVGDVVTIRKPWLVDGCYIFPKGLIIHKRRVYDDEKTKIYHTLYTILWRDREYKTGYGYSIREEVIENIVLTGNSISGVEDVISSFNSYLVSQSL